MYILIYLSLAHSFNIEFLSHGSKDMYPVSKETGNIINQVIGREMRSKPPDLKFVLCSYLYRSPRLHNEGSRLPHDRIKN